jgi:tetrahydromethanopterin S-methyltransferase subunit A
MGAVSVERDRTDEYRLADGPGWDARLDDSDGRIVGSLGKIPILKNLRREQIRRFQEQVEILDLIEEERSKR